MVPRIFSTGTILYGAHAPGYTASIDGLEDAKFHVQRLKDVGAISVKSYQQPRRDQRQTGHRRRVASWASWSCPRAAPSSSTT